MDKLLITAERMLIDRLMSNKPPLTGESKVKFILLSLSSLMVVGALSFILLALYTWLSLNFDQVVVFLGMALAMITIAFISLLSIFIIVKIKRKILKQKQKEIMLVAQDVFNGLDTEVSNAIQDNPLTAMAITTFIGYVLGEKYI